jgi:diguanylate cyclase
VGDRALEHLAQVVRETLRPTDVVARYGGEEFIIVLPETLEEAAVETLVRVQRELTRRFFLSNNERVLITFSAGTAQCLPGETREDLIDRADRALYVAKHAGRNRVEAASAIS